MELFFTLLVLYGLQCLRFLPCGAVVFAGGLGALRATNGPGWRILHPLPSRTAVVANRFPLVESKESFYSRGLVGWFSDDGLGARGPAFPSQTQIAPAVLVRGNVVRVGGKKFVRGIASSHAEKIAFLFRKLLREDDDSRRVRVEAAIRDSMSLEHFQQEEERVASATCDLAWVSDVYLGVLFVGLPALALVSGIERALLLSLPGVLLIHASTLALYNGAQRKLFPEARGERIEHLISAAVYPPLLLRSAQDLRNQALAHFHPAVVAAALLDVDARHKFLRRELASGGSAAGDPGALGLHTIERSALEDLLDAIGESPDSLLSSPEKNDPLAKSYCPACTTEYQLSSGECVDCRVALRSFVTPRT